MSGQEKLSNLFLFKHGKPGHVYMLFEILLQIKAKQINKEIENNYKNLVLLKGKWDGI